MTVGATTQPAAAQLVLARTTAELATNLLDVAQVAVDVGCGGGQFDGACGVEC